jgi:hypothetical protein
MTDRGRMLKPDEVAARYFDGAVSVRWVLKHVRPRVDLARGVIRYYERDVEAWMESRRGKAA